METATYPEIQMEPVTIEPAPPAEPIEPKTRLRPSEAIRLGRLEVPLKSSGELLVKNKKGQIIGACALGAMWVGYDGAENVAKALFTDSHWWPDDVSDDRLVDFPCGCAHDASNVQYIVAHINDYHIATQKKNQTWSEEKLATWMESVGY